MKYNEEKELDQIDAVILQMRRFPPPDLAEAVGLSTSPCWQRLRRLEADGYITGYTAKLD